MAIIDKPSDYFNTLIYTGDGSNPRTLTGVGFQPDWVWLKNRTDNNGHTLADSVRGANKTLGSDGNGAEITDKEDGHLDAFTSDGFTVGIVSDDGRVNNSGSNYVAWNWKAGGTAVSNTDGSITSSVSANQETGFSIVSYTGTGANATVGHGLGVAPNVVICKSRTAIQGWESYFSALGATQTIRLDSTAAAQTASSRWNNTAPTSSVFSLGTEVAVNGSGASLIAYCFAEKQGFSKFGSYTGNGSTNGTFVYTGFKPTFVMVKRSDGGLENWQINDTKRKTFNVNSTSLFANTSGAESTDGMYIDMLSNGFKARETGGGTNGSGSTYIYMAFAENPFVSSTGVPATAR